MRFAKLVTISKATFAFLARASARLAWERLAARAAPLGILLWEAKNKVSVLLANRPASPAKISRLTALPA